MEKLQPLISVIIPVYNTEKYLPDALDSLVNQTYQNLEIIIIDNGSSGNVKDVFNSYKCVYPKLKWKLVELPQNVGLLHARIAGFSVMSGDFFATMDSDDTISIDFYYQLLQKAILEGADVVSAKYVQNYVDQKTMIHATLNDLEICDFKATGKNILSKYMNAHGHSFNYHALWCKLYNRSIWEKSQEFFEEIVGEIVYCEDILTTAIFLGNADKWVNVCNVQYYHAIRSASAVGTMNSDVKKIKTSFEQTNLAFEYLKNFLKKIHRFEELEEGYFEYRRRFFSIIFNKISESKLSSHQKTKCNIYGCNIMKEQKECLLKPTDFYFESRWAPFNNKLEEILEALKSKDIQVVSFDIFDTLIERPFLRPDDIFEFLAREYNKKSKTIKHINFAEYRRSAERIAYEKITKGSPFRYEVTIDEIYDELIYEGILDLEDATELKRKEIELEYRFCKSREVGRYLYDYALRNGKQVICISDMYLSSDIISRILNMNGYTNLSGIYVSADEGVCKRDGKLYKLIKGKLNIKPEQICHIGDNWESDYLMAQKSGLRAFYLPSAKDVFFNMSKNESYTSNAFQEIMNWDYGFKSPALYLTNRCMAGLAINKLFVNPFVTFSVESNFDCNPNIIGYYFLGSYVFCVAKWILEQVKNSGYDTIHFIARDGKIFKKAYDILVANSDEVYPKSNYLHVSRSSLMPLMINSPTDIFSIKNLLEIFAFTPNKFLEKMELIIPQDIYKKRDEILKKSGIIPDSNFESEQQWNEFVRVYIENFYSSEKIGEFRKIFKEEAKKTIGPHDCTFDVGYSARTEMLLTEVIEAPIDAFYLHINEERAFIQAERAKIKLQSFHVDPCTPSWEVNILETLISALEDGCYAYNIKDGNVACQFKTLDMQQEPKAILNLIHQRAIEFVLDFVNTYPEWEEFQYRFGDVPFKYYLHHASQFDKGILQNINFSDSMCAQHEGKTIIDLWASTPFNSNISPFDIKPIGVKGALVNYFKKHTPMWLRPFAKKVKKLLKW